MSWNGRPSRFILRVIESSDKHVRKTAGDMLQAVIVGSPVDEGTFRGNHRVSLDSPSDEKDAGVNDKDGNATARKGLNILKSAKFGGLIYIQNNMPYSVRLEDGYSKQAPDGVYRVAFQAVSEKNK